MSNAAFLRCLAFTLDQEGGSRFTNNPDDPGGATRWGITLATLRSWRHDPDLQPSDVQNLGQAEATAIYATEHWARERCDRLPNGIDLMVFDFGVPSGPVRSVRFLQTAVGFAGADVDGWVGDETLERVLGGDSLGLIQALGDAQAAFYKSLPGAAVFGNGWLSRTHRRIDAALSMMSATAIA